MSICSYTKGEYTSAGGREKQFKVQDETPAMADESLGRNGASDGWPPLSKRLVRCCKKLAMSYLRLTLLPGRPGRRSILCINFSPIRTR